MSSAIFSIYDVNVSLANIGLHDAGKLNIVICIFYTA